MRLLGGLLDQRLVDMWDDTTTGDGSLDEGVQLLVTADGQLQMAGGHTLHLQILGGVASQLKHLSGQVLQDRGGVDSGGGTNALVRRHTGLQETMDTTNWEL